MKQIHLVSFTVRDHPVVARLQIERYRRMSDAQRLEIGLRMWEFARDIIASSIRNEHPDISRFELDRLVARRMCA